MLGFDSPAAFEPFYDETIVVEGRRGSRPVKGTFSACVFDTAYADGMLPGDAESEMRTFSVSVRVGDWIDGTPPQVGDRITFERDGIGFKLAVSSVEPVIGSWTCQAREVK